MNDMYCEDLLAVGRRGPIGVLFRGSEFEHKSFVYHHVKSVRAYCCFKAVLHVKFYLDRASQSANIVGNFWSLLLIPGP